MCFVYYTSILVSALITKSSLDILIGVFFMLIWIFSRCFHYGVGQRNYGGSYWDICILTYRLSGEESSADVSATQSELISPVTAVRAADGAYMHICETEVFSMGVFLLRSGASIPLHVHPDMNGNLRSNLIRKLPFQRIQLARRSHRA